MHIRAGGLVCLPNKAGHEHCAEATVFMRLSLTTRSISGSIYQALCSFGRKKTFELASRKVHRQRNLADKATMGYLLL